MHCKFSPVLGFTVAVLMPEERDMFAECTPEELFGVLQRYVYAVQPFTYCYKMFMLTQDESIFVWIDESDKHKAKEKIETVFQYAKVTYKKWRKFFIIRPDRANNA